MSWINYMTTGKVPWSAYANLSRSYLMYLSENGHFFSSNIVYKVLLLG